MLLLAVLCAGLHSAARAQFIAPEGQSFRNGATLPLEDDGQARTLLAKLQGAIDRGDADESAALVRALRANALPALVPFGSRTHVPALALAGRMVRETGSPAVVARVEADLAAALAEAQATRDLGGLLELAGRAHSFAAGSAATLAAARLSFERGDWWVAQALAARVADHPGGAALLAASSAHLAATAAAPAASQPLASARSWRWQGGYRFPFTPESDDSYSLPALAEGTAGEFLLLRTEGLLGLQRATGEPSFAQRAWLKDLLPESALTNDRPNPTAFTWALAGDRLIVPANLPVRGRWREISTPTDAHLLAIDPGGVVAWRVAVPRAGAASVAIGPPAVSGPRLFVQIFRVGLVTDVSLAAFAVADGRLLFEVPLASAAQVPRFASRLAETDVEDLDKRPREGPVAVHGGLVYACTGFGVVAVVDGLTGHLRHTFRYDRVFPQDPDVYEPAFLFETGGWDEEPVRLYGERLVVAPSDSRFLYMLALEPGPGGQLILDDPIEKLDRVHVAALRPDPQGRPSPAVLCTRRRGGLSSLVLLGPDGHTLASSPALPAEQAVLGRPLCLGERVLLPTAAGVQVFEAGNLQAPPQSFPLVDSVPAGVVSIQTLGDGVVTLSPLIERAGWPGTWYLLWFAAQP
ncbi:MAG: hypothetical protein ACT4PU_00830 [Planctomycetota bacterium]